MDKPPMMSVVNLMKKSAFTKGYFADGGLHESTRSVFPMNHATGATPGPPSPEGGVGIGITAAIDTDSDRDG
jgi:hypothetical protein